MRGRKKHEKHTDLRIFYHIFTFLYYITYYSAPICPVFKRENLGTYVVPASLVAFYDL